jgi:glycosyltransferase involved in cell wall biosynthesis
VEARAFVEVLAVSVIIAVKNSARYLEECLQGVAAQTFEDYEIVVVDGHSTDATEAIARRHPKVRFFQQTGTGFADAWNCGLRWSRAPLVSFVDSDDVWTPRKLEQQVRLISQEPWLEAVVGRVRFMLEPGETPPRGFRAKVFGRDHLTHMPGVLLARRSLFEALGDWGEGWVVCNDIDWFLKLRDSGRPVGVVDDLLLHKRVHGRNFSYSHAEDPVYPREILRLLHDSILRKRAAAISGRR